MIVYSPESEEVWENYRRLEFKNLITDDVDSIPKKKITALKKAIEEVTNSKLRLLDLQKIILPVAVEYRVNHTLVWQRVQGWVRTTPKTSSGVNR